jgi:uncharacterized protein YcbX
MHAVRVEQLWRYPVKSLQGEAINEALVSGDGVAGDRVVHVAGPRGPLTGRTRPGLLTISAITGTNGRPRIDSHPWDSPTALALIRKHAGADARLIEDHTAGRFDILNLLVATDGAVNTFGHDVRRLRPNLLLSGIPADLEPKLEGRALAIGDVVIGLHSLRQRCVVTSIDPDTGAQDLDVFRRIRTVFGGKLALNSWVIRPGRIRVGDTAELVDAPAEPAHIGGWIVGAHYPHVTSKQPPA